MSILNTKIFEKVRIAVVVLLAISVVSFFWLVFRQIDFQLSNFNFRVLRTINDNKAKMVQRELNDLDKLINKLTYAMDVDPETFVPILLKGEPISELIVGGTYYLKEGNRVYSWGTAVELYPLHAVDTILYRPGTCPAIDVYKTTEKGVVCYKVDLMKAQKYFESNDDGRTYFELYDQNGNCWIHPDESMIGKSSADIGIEAVGKDEMIVNSDYLKLPVFRNIYYLGGIFERTVLYVCIPILSVDDEVKNVTDFSFLLSISGIILMTVFLITINRLRQKTDRLALHNMAHAKEEEMLRFENLKRKVDPHFLFNALGSLQQLISQDAKQAQAFVGKMSRVYRKFLSTNDTGLSTLKEEITLAEEYYFLQKIRFGEALCALDIALPSNLLTKQLPRFSLQILIENAIKHNEISAEKPLKIDIYFDDNLICVANTYAPRRKKEISTGYGTGLIGNVYNYYQTKGFTYGALDQMYIVKLPFIKA